MLPDFYLKHFSMRYVIETDYKEVLVPLTIVTKTRTVLNRLFYTYIPPSILKVY